MIQSIIDIFGRQAREHKAIKAFYYNRNYELGSGREMHPLLWLEDPVSGDNRDNMFVNSVNFSVLFIPKDNAEVVKLQDIAFSIGLNIIERIRKHQNEYRIAVQPGWSYTTLRDYYDNNACGCRFSVDFSQMNMQNLCLIDEQFDEDGTFGECKVLEDFDVSPSSNCEVFSNKLPVFELKTKKG